MRLRTVALVNRLVHGGAERLAYQLVRDLDPQRFDRTLCVTRADDPGHAVPGSEPAAWRDELRADGVRVIELRRRGRADLAAWAPLWRELRRSDVLHAHMFGSNVWASVLGPAARVPVVISHEHAWAHTGGRHQALIDRRLVARGSDVLIAPSSIVAGRMVEQDGVPAERVVTLPNGIEARTPTPGRDLRAELGIDAGAPVVVAVGSLRPVKRFDLLVAAAARLRDRVPGLCVLIAGDGSERSRLEAAIAADGLEGTVRLLGARSDVPDVLTAADVAVTCSDAEASPLAIMEYMAAGLPTVATRVGGIPEVIEEGVDGVLVPPGDPDALACEVAALLDDPDRRAALGAAARRHRAERFDLSVMVERVEQLYLRLHREAAGDAQPRRRRRGGQLGTTDDGVEIPKT